MNRFTCGCVCHIDIIKVEMNQLIDVRLSSHSKMVNVNVLIINVPNDKSLSLRKMPRHPNTYWECFFGVWFWGPFAPPHEIFGCI